ncbi:MAG: MFS transporter [Streptosporangiales bacterium]|nr:MFS transporter [Streptosporangiales bacterium]
MVLLGLNTSMLNVALPSIVRAFDASAFAANWILLVFMLVNTSLLVFFGRCADVFGRRETYLTGFAVFTVASLLLGFAPTIEILIGLRAVQAIGASLIIANGTVVVADAFPRRLLSSGMGVFMGVLSVAQLVGPTVGGVIADVFGWRWLFWFNVPIAAAACLWGAMTLRRVARGPREPLDIPGNVLLLGALSALLIAFSQAGSSGFANPVVIAGALIFLALTPVLTLVERRAGNPVLDMGLFRHRSFSLGNVASFTNALPRAGVVLLGALYFQTVESTTALHAAMLVLPAPIAMGVGSVLAGQLARRFHPHRVAAFGALATAVGLAPLAVLITPGLPYAPLAAAFAAGGLGTGMFLSANTTAMMASLPPGRLGVVNGVRLLLINVGMSLGTALSLALMTIFVDQAQRRLVYAGRLATAGPGAMDDLIVGFRFTFAVFAAIALFSAVVSWCSKPRAPRRP